MKERPRRLSALIDSDTCGSVLGLRIREGGPAGEQRDRGERRRRVKEGWMRRWWKKESGRDVKRKFEGLNMKKVERGAIQMENAAVQHSV